jgi:putative Holliday junction resolvase
MTTYSHNQQPAGPILALDLGQKLVGAAVSDELLITIKRLDPIKRSNWKQLLLDVQTLIRSYDAKTLVLGLPLRLDGTKGDAAEGVIHLARNFSLSLLIPVFLQDERLTSHEAETTLKTAGHNQFEVAKLIDSEAAALILRDFLNTSERRLFDLEKQAPNTK